MTGDDSFGPQLAGHFDFTLLFEQSIFTTLPASIFLCISPLYIGRLLRQPVQVRPGVLLWAKVVGSSLHRAPHLILTWYR